MDPSGPAQFDIFDIYRRFCDIKCGNDYACMRNVHTQDDESQKAKFCRGALAELLRLIHSRLPARNSIFDELPNLMSWLNFSVMDFTEFSRLYDFVFFICRENGQKNITVNKAVAAWKLILTGRFRLLKQWCDFVERNQRYNISEDTWQQVLAFSRCVHENLEGYDPQGAWPILIDDFVDHMYRISGSRRNSDCNCKCDYSETHDDSLPGLKSIPGLKRRLTNALRFNDEEPSNASSPSTLNRDPFINSKRRRLSAHVNTGCDESISDDSMEIGRHSASPISSSKSPCSVERCLSMGIGGLFSNLSYMPFDQESRVPSI